MNIAVAASDLQGQDRDWLAETVRCAVRAEIGTRFDELHRFVDRRVAELSTELHATVQMVDFSESNLSGQLARLQEQIGHLVAAPSQAARNSGVELEAVVQTTEAAANRIMEAAEAIDSWVRATDIGGAGLNGVTEKLGAIFEACSFQDLTSQRIRRAIEHLQNVESMLVDLASGEARQPPPPPPPGSDLAQTEIDRLLVG